jgi:hypothetical protein
MENIPDIIATLGGAMACAKEALKIITASRKSKLDTAVSGLVKHITRAEIEAYELINKNRELEAKLADDNSNPVTIDDYGVYYDSNHRPYCTACYDTKNHLRTHLAIDAIYADYTALSCPSCHATYRSPLK